MSSASIFSGSQVKDASCIRRWYQWSRPSLTCTCTAAPCSRCTTTTFLIDGVPSSASSAICFSGTMLPRRQPPSAVTSSVHCESLMRSRSDSLLKPPKTTECTAPMRAQASMAIASSGMSGR
jgi:hypothetical protein